MNSTLKILALLPFLAVSSACSDSKAPEQAAAPQAEQAAAPQANTETASTMLPRSAAPEGARLYFKEPMDGATVTNPVHVEFGLGGMDVVPAGTQAPMSGHHHIIIDSELPPFDLPIPADEHNIHFGDGSTSTDLQLAPGKHTLQLLLGDHLHIPHQPPVYSERITITVE